MNAHSVDTGVNWAERIAAAWQASLDAIFETGRLLVEAKASLKHGQFQRMCESDLPFGARTAQRLMAIASDHRLTNPTHVSHLPPHWGTLYELTKLADDAFEARIAEGVIRPDMDRADLEHPSRANLRAAIGTDSATAEERGNNLYETPPEAVHALLKLESFGPVIWEPACGRGAISRLLEAAGHEVLLTDLVDYGTANEHGEVQEVGDFLQTQRSADGIRGPWRGAIQWSLDGTPEGEPDIVTNPPYGPSLNAFVAHALREHRPAKMALLLNLNFLCGFDDPDRNFVMDACPPARIHVFTRRLPMMHRDGWAGREASSRMNTAWFVWERRGDEAGQEALSGEAATGTKEKADRDGKTGGGEAGTADDEIAALYSGPTVINRVDWKDVQSDGSRSAPRASSPLAAACPAAQGNSGFGKLAWREPQYEGDRRLAMAGDLEVGAVFHPDKSGKWDGMFFLNDARVRFSRKSEAAAKAEVEKRWLEFLKKAGFADA